MGSVGLEWAGTDMSGNAVSPGVYFCDITGREEHATTKIVRLK
jgi:hypothetical protein